MLNNLRKSAAGGWAAKILIGLLVLAFATWGIADMFTTNTNTALATIGDDEVTPQEFRRARALVQRRWAQLTPEQIRSFNGPILSTLIRDKLVDAHVRSLKLGIPAKEIDRQILKDPNFVRGGEFSQSAFNQFLQYQNMGESYYLTQRRKENLREQLEGIFGGSLSRVPEPMLEAKHQYDNSQRVLSYITLTKKNIEKIKPAEEKDLKAFYDDNKRRYRAPEFRKIAFIHLSAEKMKASIKIDADKVKKLYESRKKRYTKPERRQLSQISFQDMKKAEEAHQLLSKGTKFEDVAKKYGQKAEDTSLGLKTRKELLDKTIANAVFKLKKGEFSKPLKGALNISIVKVEKIEAEQVTPFKKVEKEITERLAGEQARKQLSKLAKAIENDRADGVAMKKIAEKHKVQYQEAVIDRRGYGEDNKKVATVPSAPVFLKEVFDSDKGLDNDQIDISRRETAWFDVIDLTQERIKKYDEVKTVVASDWLEDKENKAIRARAKDVKKKLEGGAKFADIAKSLSVKIEKTKPIKRTETPKGLTRATVAQGFSLEKSSAGISTSSDRKGRIVFVVEDVKAAPKLEDKQKKELETVLSRNITQDFRGQYLRGLRSEFNLVINNQLVQSELGTTSAGI